MLRLPTFAFGAELAAGVRLSSSALMLSMSNFSFFDSGFDSGFGSGRGLIFGTMGGGGLAINGSEVA